MGGRLMKSIKTKIMLLFMGVLILTVVVSFVSFEITMNQVFDFTSTLLEKEVADKEALVEQSTKSNTDDIRKVSLLLANQFAMNQGVIDGVLQNDKTMVHNALKQSTESAKTEVGIDLIWITRLEDRTADGRTPILACPTNPDYDGYDGLNYASTNETLNTGKAVVSWEVNEEDGKLQVNVPIMSNGSVIGAIIVGQQTYSPMISKISNIANTGSTLFLYNASDFYVMADTKVDTIGEYISAQSHEEIKENSKLLSELAKEDEVFSQLSTALGEIKETKEADTRNMTLNGEEYVIYFQPLLNYNGELSGILAHRFPNVVSSQTEFQNVISRVKLSLYVVYSILIIVSAALCYFTIMKLLKPLKDLKVISHSISEGDFTQKIECKTNDEIGELANDFNNMRQSMSALIANIMHTSNEVAVSADKVTQNTQQSSVAINETARTVDDISSGASEQAKNTQEGYNRILEFETIIEDNQKNMLELNEATKKVVFSVKEGLTVLDSLIEKNKENSLAVNAIYEVINSTKNSSTRINNASSVITSIAEQTNLLALNAAIEAARAGEAGKGFSVVADEIRKLAEQSRQSTNEIDAVINELQINVNEAVKTMQDIMEIMKYQELSVKTTELKYKDIDENIKMTTKIVDIMNISGHEMQKKKKEMFTIIESLSAIADENAAGAEEVSASTQELASSMKGIADSSLNLYRSTQELNGSIQRFKVATE